MAPGGGTAGRGGKPAARPPAALGPWARLCLCCASPWLPPSWPSPLLLQMSKVWNDLQPKLRCLFVGPHSAPAPPRPPQDGPSAH